MSTITVKNRYESYKKIQENPYTLYAKVLAALSNKKEMTAREIAKAIGLNSRQDIQPRLNELRDKHGLIEEAGEIKNLELQPRFLLQESFKKNNKTYRKIEYIADFKYKENGQVIVEDVKGKETDVFKLKRKMFEHQYKDLSLRILTRKDI